MNKKALIILVLCFLSLPLKAQNNSDYRNFPLVITLQFHSLAMPFQDIPTGFSNFGISIGTEFSHNSRHNRAQQFSLGWYRNKSIGNGLMFYTQSAWRPDITLNAYTEVKAGVGYLYAFRPSESFKQTEGRWESAGRQGKGMLMLPAGMSIGYNNYSSDLYASPFLSYQLMLVKGYNRSIPIVPQRLIQIGSRLHL